MKVHEARRLMHQRELAEAEALGKVRAQCDAQIRRDAAKEQPWTTFVVPRSLRSLMSVGQAQRVPDYDAAALATRLGHALIRDGYSVRFLQESPRQLYISWHETEEEKQRTLASARQAAAAAAAPSRLPRPAPKQISFNEARRIGQHAMQLAAQIEINRLHQQA